MRRASGLPGPPRRLRRGGLDGTFHRRVQIRPGGCRPRCECVSFRRNCHLRLEEPPSQRRRRGPPMMDPATLDWVKENGLLPAIVQDVASGAVLMLGYMNREALAETLSS